MRINENSLRKWLNSHSQKFCIFLLGSKTKLTSWKEFGRLIVHTSYNIIRINGCYEEVKWSFIDRQITW